MNLIHKHSRKLIEGINPKWGKKLIKYGDFEEAGESKELKKGESPYIVEAPKPKLTAPISTDEVPKPKRRRGRPAKTTLIEQPQ